MNYKGGSGGQGEGAKVEDALHHWAECLQGRAVSAWAEYLARRRVLQEIITRVKFPPATAQLAPAPSCNRSSSWGPVLIMLSGSRELPKALWALAREAVVEQGQSALLDGRVLVHVGMANLLPRTDVSRGYHAGLHGAPPAVAVDHLDAGLARVVHHADDRVHGSAVQRLHQLLRAPRHVLRRGIVGEPGPAGPLAAVLAD
eukprot:CAMPEP_0182865778 /NCGR_PEP_ID=MMETSP0034_2-20130328/7870_1 /TAXON_ID=156128 /ORGANISM="Nephroselmis pyriformis, Strain CCMP717" /LENGTH=200 /DNA_ID=CAMNT_0024998095 /DNA_START=170 /DNA_END=770 /DNA_ORIENTATION=-